MRRYFSPTLPLPHSPTLLLGFVIILAISLRCFAAAPAAFAPPKPVIVSVEPSAKSVAQYDTVELSVTLEAAYRNGFDPSEIQVTGQFVDPIGNLRVAGGFLYREYERRLDDGFERLTPKGKPQWRIRFTPELPGEYVYVVSVVTPGGRTFSGRQTFACTAARRQGFVRRISGRYLEYDSGEPFFIIGQNLAWGGPGGTHEYDQWLEKLAASGANFARIWFWRNRTFDLEVMPDRDGNGGIGTYDLANAWRLDYVLGRCEQLGIKVMLCLFDFHPLTEDFSWGGFTHHPWEGCVYNKLNGGPLESPDDFFTDEQAIAYARRFVRYVISRYAHSTAIASWEIFNEADLAPGYTGGMGDCYLWHRQMAELIDSLDPWHRPITTSLAQAANAGSLWKIPQIRIVQSHSYNERDMGAALPEYVRSFDELDKPHLFGELGCDVDFTGDKLKDDPTGIHLHNAIWASIAGGSAGGALTWWWDSYVDPMNLYPVYTAPSKFAATIPWTSETFAPAAVQVQASTDDVAEGAAVNAYVHGATHKKDLGDGPTFELDFANDGIFAVTVDKVSTGAVLKIYLDNRLVLWEDLPASKARGSWKRITWQKDYGTWEAVYDRTFAITLPKGKHTVAVRNDGLDWMTLSAVKLLNYSDRGVTTNLSIVTRWEEAKHSTYKVSANGKLTGYSPVPLRATALAGSKTIIAWVQNRGNTWYRRRGGLPEPDPARALVVFPDFGPGLYNVQRWNTTTGEIDGEFDIEISDDAVLQFPTPPIATDVAYRVQKIDPTKLPKKGESRIIP